LCAWAAAVAIKNALNTNQSKLAMVRDKVGAMDWCCLGNLMPGIEKLSPERVDAK